jgi:hypothetical protein
VRRFFRWVVVLTLPIGLLAIMTSSAAAGISGQQLIAHDHQAYRHCTTGGNQDGNVVSNCFATPYEYTSEGGWWWWGMISESWYNGSGGWISNSWDSIYNNPFSDWQTVQGP